MLHQDKERERQPENPFRSDYKKNTCSKLISKEMMNELDMELAPLEEFTERVGRSQSHFVFQFRPEHVPKPKPKKTLVQPTPMILCLKSIQEEVGPSLYLKNKDDPYLSCPSSDSESDFSTEEAEQIPFEYTISNQRKEMNKIRSKTMVDINNTKAKESDDIEGKEKKSLERIMNKEESANNRLSSVFSRSIKTILKKEKEDNKRMTMGPSTRSQSGLSLLKVLEVSAEKVNKKSNKANNIINVDKDKDEIINTNTNSNTNALIQLRLKRSSTIV